MDFSSVNINTILLVSIAILVIYFGIKFLNIIGKVICITIGILLLIFVLQKLGVTVPMIGELTKFFFDSLEVVLRNIQEFISRITA